MAKKSAILIIMDGWGLGKVEMPMRSVMLKLLLSVPYTPNTPTAPW